MATRTRYFVIVSLLVLGVGLGTGLVAYYVGFPIGAIRRHLIADSPLPARLRAQLEAAVRAALIQAGARGHADSPRRGQTQAQGAARRAPGCAHLGRRHPRQRQL